jgi:hypothetical protein
VLRVGDACDQPTQGQGQGRRWRTGCPRGSHCSGHGRCHCRSDLVATRDRSACRPPVFGEACHKRLSPCRADVGLECQTVASGDSQQYPSEGVCGCKASHHPPSSWTTFILSRWNYSAVNEASQQCIASMTSSQRYDVILLLCPTPEAVTSLLYVYRGSGRGVCD